MSLKNDLILRVITGEETERTPIWLMRQAGRILPQYRKIREKLSGFKELVQTPELACEVTIQPVDELGVDAAIIFSDILVIPEAMGLDYQMVEKKGPYFPEVIKTANDLDKLRIAEPEESLNYVTKALQLTKSELNGHVPLIGFAGAPWTLFCYMTEGQGSKTFSVARKMLYTEKELSERLLNMITESTIKYLKAQINAGADLVQVFDSWAGILPPGLYKEYGLKYIRKICEAINEVPVIVFSRGAYYVREEFGGLPCDVIGLDWNMPVKESIELIGTKKAFQGNLDPCLLYAKPDIIKKGTEEMLQAFKNTRHIANLGHGVYPDTPLDHVKVFIDAVKDVK